MAEFFPTVSSALDKREYLVIITDFFCIKNICCDETGQMSGHNIWF